VACNTASALALPAIRKAVGVDVIGVIEPGAHAAVAASKSGRIGVIATEATVESGAYSKAIARLEGRAQVFETPCPLFVSLAEEGWAESDEARSVALKYLKEIKASEVDTLVMGCTHYPILRNVIQETIGQEVRLIDSGEAAALYVTTLLETKDLARRDGGGGVHAGERRLCDDLDHFYVTDAAARFARVAERFLGSAPSVLEAVEVWGQDELRAR
jgi:glutamate racemase